MEVLLRLVIELVPTLLHNPGNFRDDLGSESTAWPETFVARAYGLDG